MSESRAGDVRLDTRTRSSLWLAEHAAWVIGIALGLTALLAIPFLTMEPDTTASQEPGGPVFDARDRIEGRFVSSVFPTFLIVESNDGDMLRADPLRALLAAETELRADPEIGPTLLSFFDADTQTETVGVISIADLVDAQLPGGLGTATDDQVKAVAAGLVDALGVRSDVLGLSSQTRFDEAAGHWVAPAVFFPVLSDNDLLGFTAVGVDLGGGTESEEHSRRVLELIRSDATEYGAWGVAIDVNLTSQEQGEAAGPFIGFTILAVLIIVGLVFRSYWMLAITGAALASLIVWLQGLSNLIGFEDDLILTLIVPIAMISFGVDFAFHAVGRYREKRALGLVPRAAFTTGLAAVASALVLALASDAVAFLSNVSSGIESIIQFGLSAAIALAAAFLLLGIVTPLAVSIVDTKIGEPKTSRLRTAGRVAASVGAALLAMATVLLMVFILPVAGVIALGIYLIVAIAIPYRLSRSGEPHAAGPETGPGAVATRIGDALTAVARRRRAVLPVAAALTIAAAALAIRVPTEFDVEDFFASDTDFVVGLDRLDAHIGDQGGEPAQIYIESDLTDPAALRAIRDFETELGAVASTQLARNEDGTVASGRSVLRVLDEVWRSPPTLAMFEQATGTQLTDSDDDGIPDDGAQIAALYDLTRQAGVAFDATRLTLTPDEVSWSIWVAADGSRHATVIEVGIISSRLQESIVEARVDLRPTIDAFRTELQLIDPDAVVQLTGPPIVRQTSLEAISRALQVSLPIAVVLCLLIAAAFMRSLRYGLVVIVPILMTVAWLYAFMYLFGFSINIVTATIGAVSIGIGIDFAIHYSVRYREELAGAGERLAAVTAAGVGTGTALVASAFSSVVGFAILALAPMPLFASYGLLTAIMILMALLSTLVVLPSLLVVMTRDHAPTVRSTPETKLQHA